MTIQPIDQHKEVLRLAALYELHILDTPPEDRFDRITRLAALLLNAPTAYISFVDAKRQWFKSKCNLDQSELPRDISFCTYTIEQEGLMIVPDTLSDPRFAKSPLVVNDPHTRFYAGYPLTTPEGFKVGTLCVVDKVPRDFSSTELHLFKDLALLAEDQLNLVDIIKLERQLQDINQELVQTKQNLQIRNDFIHRAFSCYMSDEVLARLLQSSESLQLGGEEREITVLFSDLRDFTVLSEALSAERIVGMLNVYYSKMIDIILRYKGTIDAIIGDALLVLFGAPCSSKDDSLRACACAIEMQLAMAEINEENVKQGLPKLAMGIGINTGKAIVGNIGSARRMKYSAIGSTVNLASRIEGFSLGNQILISQSTLQEVQNIVNISGHLKVKLKGIASPVTIYDINGVGDPYHLKLRDY